MEPIPEPGQEKPPPPDPAEIGAGKDVPTIAATPAGVMPAPAEPAGVSERATNNAKSYLESGNVDGAIRSATQALMADPRNRRAYLMRAYAAKAKQDWPSVIKDAKAALAIKPDDPQFLKLEADAENRMKLCQDGLKAASRAVAVSPTDATAVAIKAWSLGCLGDREGMLALLREAAALDPRFQASLESAADLADESDLFFLFPGEKMSSRKKRPSGLTRTQVLGISAGLALCTLIAFVAAILHLVRARNPVQTLPAASGPQVRGLVPAQEAEPAPAVQAASVEAASLGFRTTTVPQRYEIRQMIGEGGMGQVFGGFDRELMRPVAIKKMRPELRERREDLEKFLVEARTIAQLSHPYIVSIHDIAQTEGDVFLVFDYVDGKPLSAVLDACKRMPWSQCLDIFDRVCQAVDCAHRAKILHLDLKPANIMIDSNGFAKVMDFGLARHAKETLSRVTRQGVGGTLAYMAPEQHQGFFCPASDVYAMGVCLYEMLTGQLPFPGPDFLAMKERLLYASPRTLALDIPQGLEQVFRDVFAPDPKARLADSMEFLQRLKRL